MEQVKKFDPFFQNANQEMQKFLNNFNKNEKSEITLNNNAQKILNKYKDLRKEAKFAMDSFDKRVFYERYTQVKNIFNKQYTLSQQEAINKAKEIEIEQQRQVNKYQALLAQEEIERIAAKKSSKEETQLNIIEVKASDFCSVKSRACLQSIFVSSIRLPFYNAMIRFLNDDDTQTEINYVYKNGILTFNIPGDSLILNLDNQDKTLIEYLSNNNYTLEQSNIIYDTVSVLLYVSQYVKKKNPIQTKQQLLQPIPQEIFIKTIDTAPNTKTSIIKVDFTKINAAVEGRTEQKATSSLTSHAKTLVIGYWRNQKYKDGYKLIWIAPFWRGNGQRIKEKLYKII